MFSNDCNVMRQASLMGHRPGARNASSVRLGAFLIHTPLWVMNNGTLLMVEGKNHKLTKIKNNLDMLIN